MCVWGDFLVKKDVVGRERTVSGSVRGEEVLRYVEEGVQLFIL